MILNQVEYFLFSFDDYVKIILYFALSELKSAVCYQYCELFALIWRVYTVVHQTHFVDISLISFFCVQ